MVQAAPEATTVRYRGAGPGGGGVGQYIRDHKVAVGAGALVFLVGGFILWRRHQAANSQSNTGSTTPYGTSGASVYEVAPGYLSQAGSSATAADTYSALLSYEQYLASQGAAGNNTTTGNSGAGGGSGGGNGPGSGTPAQRFDIGHGYKIGRAGTLGAIDLYNPQGGLVGSYWIPKTGREKIGAGFSIGEAGSKAPGAVDVYNPSGGLVGAYQT